ncbi:MAG TPA: Gfo/Idh/MocA family oxidoreductase [Symbiobacteriaceae bacterium]|nr:Gfo/Idh/MocA family oxidoreductase [Symbiobacteriaceae bacterium]
MKVAVVGYGYWGPNLVRNLVGILGAENVTVCDLAPERRGRAERDYPGMRTVPQISEILQDPTISALFIATPATTHRELATSALEAGKHVLVEKPMATSAAEGEAMLALAAQRGLVLMSDHTFVFNPAVVALKGLLDAGRLGRVEAVLSNRVNLGLHRPDVDVVWDLYIHDLSILQYWLGCPPESITAMGRDLLGTGQLDVAFLAARYRTGCIAQVNVAWLAPRKSREMTVIGSRAMAIYDDTAPERLRLFETRGEVKAGRVEYVAGEPIPVASDGREALACLIEHFLACIRTGQQPVTGPEFALEILRTLEAVGRALKAPGTPVTTGGDR